ncbi:FG-GAP repeat domain-containing protein [Streptomyces sp. NPDC001480]|uniref:FG-GAP repeat domain-containing protein n=1 Tax=Streptomyces sp. NPDC001480 TaxID=3364577 RepID=UPI0036BBEF12
MRKSHIPAVGRSYSFTGNGRPDILACDPEAAELYVHPHTGWYNGLDTYGAPVLIARGAEFASCQWIGAGDFNGNGLADIIVITADNKCLLHLNQGGLDGLNTLGEALHVGGKLPDVSYDTIAIGDITGSGTTDIIGRLEGTGEIHFIPSLGKVDGTNTFGPPIHFTTLGTTDTPVGLADVTGTGEPDLLVRHPNGDLSAVDFFAAGKREDGYPAEGEGTWYPVGRGFDAYRTLTITDVNGDGKPDLVGVRADGALVAHTHSRVFDPGNPLATFQAPVAVGAGWDHYANIS